jgi:hypothetical protein
MEQATMMHCMIDIETLGKRPNAPILSIGAVKFDPETGKTSGGFYEAIDPADSFKYGVPDGDTFKWWMMQSDAARNAAVSGKCMLPDALKKLAAFYPNWKEVKVWGNGPSFDMTILEYAYHRALDQESAPWEFWNIRDCRTIANITGEWPPKIGGKGVHHNALDDAKHQAAWVSRMWQQLRKTKNQKTKEEDFGLGDL